MKRVFQPSDIKYVKSVTRDKGANWAYMEYNVGDTFDLNFSKNPKWYPTNYLKAKPNELIVLFQTLLPTENLVKGWYVTHLVTPLDNVISKVDNNPGHPYIRRVCVVGKINIHKRINDNLWSFFKCNRGQICKLETIERRFDEDFTLEQKQKFVWGLYNEIEPVLFNEIESLQNEQLDLETVVVSEGAERTILKLHKIRERDSSIIASAKALAKKEKRFYCEVCTFNFEEYYPGLGKGFIECHHKQPISLGGVRITKVQDLAIVCANCHRMLHRKNEEGNYYNIDELRGLIK